MRPALLLAAILVIVAACSSPAPSASPLPTSPSASPAAPASEAPRPSTGSSDPSATPAAPVTPAPPAETPAPTEAPAEPMTPEEEALIGQLRLDAAVNCAPRREDLPEGAIRAIECEPADPLVARVGIYLFGEGNQAAYTYMTRMASFGVDVNAGNCNDDIPGEQAWTPGDGEGDINDPGVFNWENEALSPARIGCFLDENGTANVRATCGFAYIGVLGTGSDLSELTDWTWRYPAGYEPGTPDAPGICVGDGLIDPDVAEPS